MKMETKICTKCKSPKPMGDYSKDKNRPDGRYPYCKACRKQFYQDNKVHTAQLARKYREDNPAARLLTKAKQRATRLGLPFTLTPQDVVVPKVCPVLGIPLVIGKRVFGPNSPTLDRLRPEKGYEPGNVAVISFRANLIKNNASVDEIERVAVWMRTQGL